MKTLKFFLAAVLMLLLVNMATAQNTATEIPHKGGPIYIFAFPDIDSATGYPQVTADIDIGLIRGGGLFTSYYTNAPAADSFLVSIEGLFEARPGYSYWDSLGYFYIVGAATPTVKSIVGDTIAMKAGGNAYQQIRLKIRPYWASTAPYNSLSNLYVYLQIRGRGVNYIPPVRDYIWQVPRGQ